MRHWLEVTLVENDLKVLLNLDYVVSFGPSKALPGKTAICIRGEDSPVHCEETYEDIKKAIKL